MLGFPLVRLERRLSVDPVKNPSEDEINRKVRRDEAVMRVLAAGRRIIQRQGDVAPLRKGTDLGPLDEVTKTSFSLLDPASSAASPTEAGEAEKGGSTF